MDEHQRDECELPSLGEFLSDLAKTEGSVGPCDPVGGHFIDMETAEKICGQVMQDAQALFVREGGELMTRRGIRYLVPITEELMEDSGNACSEAQQSAQAIESEPLEFDGNGYRSLWDEIKNPMRCPPRS